MPTFNLTLEQKRIFEQNHISAQQLDTIIAQFNEILTSMAAGAALRPGFTETLDSMAVPERLPGRLYSRDEQVQGWESPKKHRAIKVKAKVVED